MRALEEVVVRIGESPQRKVPNLFANDSLDFFALLYGYVRHFHRTVKYQMVLSRAITVMRGKGLLHVLGVVGHVQDIIYLHQELLHEIICPLESLYLGG